MAKIKCPNCENGPAGRGTVICPTCRGTKKEIGTDNDCPTCLNAGGVFPLWDGMGNNGYIKCPSCDGKGYHEEDNDKESYEEQYRSNYSSKSHSRSMGCFPILVLVGIIIIVIPIFLHGLFQDNSQVTEKRRIESERRATNTAQELSMHISPKCVWSPQNDEWENITEICENNLDCIASRMREEGATLEAINFTRLMEGGVYLSSFQEMGKVDLAEITSPLFNDPNVTSYIFVNGSPAIQRLDISSIDIQKDRSYRRLINRFPNIELWPMHQFVKMNKTSRGGQSFIFSFMLLNGCRGCEIAGSAEISFDFDERGQFVRSRLIQLIE